MSRPRGVTPEPERSRLLVAAADARWATHTADQAGNDLRAAVQAAHTAGGSIREIAALINKSTATIQKWLREA